jgi:hypothetical protein
MKKPSKSELKKSLLRRAVQNIRREIVQSKKQKK